MRKHTAALLSFFFATFCLAEAPGEQAKLLVAAPSVTVTTEDFNYYVDMMIPEERRESALAREGAVQQAIESLYLVRYFAEQARQGTVKVDVDQAEWEGMHHTQRSLMNAYLDKRVRADMKTQDFSTMAKEEYMASPEAYRIPEKRKAAHVLVDIATRTDEEALARIQEARTEIQNGASFADVAVRYSDDTTAVENGGDLGAFGPGQMVKPFEEAAFALEVGVLSQPVRTRFGYHLILVEEIIPSEIRPFEEVEREISRKLRQARERQIRQKYIEEARANAGENGVLINNETVNELVKKYAAEDAPMSGNP